MAGGRKRVMLIATDQQRCQQWEQYLRAADCQTLTVAGTEEAIEQISEYLPVLLFIHVDMDTGIHVADVDEKFAQRCRDSGLAVIPVLTHPSPEDVAASFRRGAVDVLIEPFNQDDLSVAVERAGGFKDLYQQNMDFRRQLERANRDLRENISILRMDQIAGRQVQQNMLPVTPLRHGDYEIAHRIIPSLYLSGDFVGYNILFDRYLLFYFADVSGHGASSAFVTVMLGFILRRILRRHLADNDFEALARAPEGFVEHINRQILAMGLDKHLTIFAGAIDMQRNMLRYTVGAQLPMPVFVDGNDARFLSGSGKPVGLFPDAVWEVQEIALPERFALVVASDGVLDCLPGATMGQKEERLLAAASRCGMQHELLCAELGFNDIKEAPDDVSVMTVTRGG